MSYNLRSTTRLDSELAKLGAHTSGSVARKQERLQRFRDAESRYNDSKQNLTVVIENEQRKVYERSQARSAEMREPREPYNTRSRRTLLALILSYLY